MSPTAAPELILPENRVVDVKDLSVSFVTSERTVTAVKSLSFHVDRGETLAIVGESGSGKSVTSLALMRIVEHGGGRIVGGRLNFRCRDGRVLDLARADDATMRHIRGADIAMIFQEPMTSLNPVFTAGEQIAESIREHQGMNHAAARAEALRMLDLVRIPEARNVLDRYPHQLSGGMRQRVMIALALARAPRLLVADEPTTALDVSVQADILRVLREAAQSAGCAVLFVTHDLGVARHMCDEIAVMKDGEIVETGTAEQVILDPQVAYTKRLMASRLTLQTDRDRPVGLPDSPSATARPLPWWASPDPASRQRCGSRRASRSATPAG